MRFRALPLVLILAVPGVHLAFGDPYGSQTHADWKSKTHVDVLTRNCNVWIDDDQVHSPDREAMPVTGDREPGELDIQRRNVV